MGMEIIDGNVRSCTWSLARKLVLEACAQGARGARARSVQTSDLDRRGRTHPLCTPQVNLETDINDVANLILVEKA